MYLLLLAMACSPTPAPTTADPTASAQVEPLADVTVDQLAAADNAFVIDVRTAGEYASGHVPGAVNLPVDQVADGFSALDIPEGAEVYAICQAGGRSARAASILAAQGVAVHNVTGGTGAWIAAGHPTE